ncbi:hypothetical protein DRQ25_12160 [Candidatus Fermentibacteria bacterium]|nr:MAG: hypothetical protein DRQ25_12160 [Candidatus Fermentibacteria bacterium]
MKPYIYPYKLGSGSARNLASVMNCKRIKPTPESTYVPRASHLIINYGSSSMDIGHPATVLNKPVAVGLATNKLKAFQTLREYGVLVPEFTTSLEEAQSWEGKVVGRTKLQGCGGEGISIYPEGEIDASISTKLYTKYIKKTKEYRVHVFKKPDGTYSTDRIQVKKLTRSTDVIELFTHEIRNHQNGWVFSSVFEREGDTWNQSIIDESIKATKALGLDFCAVDVIWNRRKGVYVLEANTAPGLEGETLTSYKENFNLYLT